MLLKSDSLEQLSEKASTELIAPLTELLHSLASTSGWSPSIVSALKVNINEKHELFVDYPDALKEEIEDLEYGAFGKLPNAVIRPFILRAPDIISNILETHIVSELFYSMGVI